MSYRPKVVAICVTLAVLICGSMLLHMVATGAGPDAEEAKDPLKIVSTQILGGSQRYLTHVSTDKQIYRPGERVYVRSVVLHQGNHKPLASNPQVSLATEIIGPKGDTVAGGQSKIEDSVAGFSWEVPPTLPGGEYTIRVSHPWTGFAPAERKFGIRVYRAPRLKNQIKFLRDGYGPGDEAVATLHTERAEGGVPSGAKVTVTARVDGAEVHRSQTTIDKDGNCVARFALPVDIRRGEGTLALAIEDGGVVETASKTIPILLQTVDLTMYPEGGDLIAERENRVYFEAFTPARKPADLAGVVVDQDGKEVATFRSEHEGRGRFAITPQAGKKYQLKITEPSGINTRYDLPTAKASGVTLRATKDVFNHDEFVTVRVDGGVAHPITVTLNKREQTLARKKLTLKYGNGTIQLKAPDWATGVLLATVWNDKGQPMAERLVFRKPAETINVKITADAEQYTPGGKASLTIETTDQDGKPVSGVVGVTVADDSVIEMIEKREQSPRLPVMVLLENDVKELADAHVYLDPNNDKAALSVDLLLGTQGWRRFAFVETAKFLDKQGDLGRRVLGLKMASQLDLVTVLSAAEAKGADHDLIRRGAVIRDLNENGIVIDELQLEQPVLAVDEAPQPDAAAAPVVQAPPPAKPQKKEAQRQNEFDDAEVLGERERLSDALKKADLAQAGNAFARRKARIPQRRNDFVTVRVYAHQVRKNREPGQRSDFTETLFWHAGVKTNEEGKATVEFGLNDSVTSFRVAADAFTSSGVLGSGTTNIESVEPFYVEPKFPLEVTAGDKIRLPIGIINSMDAAIDQTRLTANSHALLVINSQLSPFNLPADSRIRRLIEINVGQHNGLAELTLDAVAGPYADKVTRTITVKPQGFPIEFGKGGLVTPGDTLSHDIPIPADLVPASIEGRVVVYPTPLASLTEGLKGLIRQPSGCFEQTSSTVYPLVMAQQYFRSHQGVDPSLVEKSSQILQTGYERLMGYECKSGGFEWWGKDPGHDALTAYGLMEFTDMAKVRHVERALLERTQKWLLDQRDGKGNYPRKTHTYHVWVPVPEISNSYNTWALLEAGVAEDLSTEVQWVREAAEKTENSYVMALAANVLSMGGDREGENHMLDKLAGLQTDDGSVAGATRSVVGSTGQALKIEATSLAVLAWLKNPRYASEVEKSIKFLAESCKNGRFGSTQSTILALKAIVAYDQSRAKPTSPGQLQLVVNGKPVGEPVKFDKDTQGAIELGGFAKLLTPGKHRVQVKMTGGSQMPYSVAVSYNTLKPNSSDKCSLHLHTTLRDKTVEEGNVTETDVVVVNRTNEDVPNPIAIVGVPGGLEVRHDQLKELAKANRIAAYEVKGREVILYWRVLKAEQRVELPISLIAAVPGSYRGPASRAYLYYTDEHKHWTDPLAIEVTSK